MQTGAGISLAPGKFCENIPSEISQILIQIIL